MRRLISTALEVTTYWLLIYGTYANWFFVTLAAVFGTSEITPIAGKGYGGEVWQEQLVTLGLGSVGIAMVLGVVLLAVEA